MTKRGGIQKTRDFIHDFSKPPKNLVTCNTEYIVLHKKLGTVTDFLTKSRK